MYYWQVSERENAALYTTRDVSGQHINSILFLLFLYSNVYKLQNKPKNETPIQWASRLTHAISPYYQTKHSMFRSFHQLLKKWAFYFDGVLAWTNLISNAASKLLGKLAKKSKLHLQNLYNI